MSAVPGQVVVVVGPGVVADAGLLAEIAGREFARLRVPGDIVHVRDAAHLRATAEACEVAVVLPGPEPGTRALIGQPLGPEVTVWVDLERVEPTAREHIQGRGLAGLTWGIRHAVHRARHPEARRIAYGPSPDQWGELYLPGTDGRAPVAALIHGGFWRSIWAADLMGELCSDLTQRGFAVWNLEYRRPDLHGWAAATADVASGLATLQSLAASFPVLDLDRVAVVGHSAGGQLALRAAADGTPMALVVSLAGVLDLVQGERRWVGSGAVAVALGPASTDLRAASSPLHRLPLGTRQLIVQGSGDDLDFVDFSRRHATRARQAGDDVTYLELPGGHFDVITPTTPIWQATVQAITGALS